MDLQVKGQKHPLPEMLHKTEIVHGLLAARYFVSLALNSELQALCNLRQLLNFVACMLLQLLMSCSWFFHSITISLPV